VLRILGESHEEAKRLLNGHRKQLDALAEALVERETLDEQEILKATGLPRAPTLETGKLLVPAAENRSSGPSRE
jgi:cell division protease FtsH